MNAQNKREITGFNREKEFRHRKKAKGTDKMQRTDSVVTDDMICKNTQKTENTGRSRENSKYKGKKTKNLECKLDNNGKICVNV